MQRLVITLLPDGRISLEGSQDAMGNKVLFHGMLECAKDAYRTFEQQQQSGIITAPADALPRKM